jgi:hypothetical protein
LHASSPNTASGIRSGVIYEFYEKGLAWSRRQMRADVEAENTLDMWSGWSEEVRSCDTGESADAKL